MKSWVRNAYRLHPFRSRSRLTVPAPDCSATARPDPMVAEVAARNAKGTTKKPCGRPKAWLSKSWNRLRRLGKAQRGAAAVEYALVAPLLFGVIFVAVETAVMLLADSSLEISANRVARLGKPGVPDVGPSPTSAERQMAH